MTYYTAMSHRPTNLYQLVRNIGICEIKYAPTKGMYEQIDVTMQSVKKCFKI